MKRTEIHSGEWCADQTYIVMLLGSQWDYVSVGNVLHNNVGLLSSIKSLLFSVSWINADIYYFGKKRILTVATETLTLLKS